MTRRILTAREQHEMLSPWREAAVNQDLVDRLHGEFKDWRKQQPRGSIFGGGIIGGLNEWTNIEKFLKDQYPAAHRGLGMGYEMAGPLLDGTPMHGDYMMPGPLEYSEPQPYETGPDAEAQYGYDPKEIAAAMLLLHNKSDRFRGDMSHEDQARLNDIAQKRYQMQRVYEQRNAALSEDEGQKMREVYAPHDPANPPEHLKPHLMLPIGAAHHYREYDRPYDDVLGQVIADQGIRQPLRISTDGTHATMHEGNHRLEIAKRLGLTHVPVQVTLEKPGEVINNGGRPPAPLEQHLGDWIDQNRHRLKSFWKG